MSHSGSGAGAGGKKPFSWSTAVVATALEATKKKKKPPKKPEEPADEGSAAEEGFDDAAAPGVSGAWSAVVAKGRRGRKLTTTTAAPTQSSVSQPQSQSDSRKSVTEEVKKPEVKKDDEGKKSERIEVKKSEEAVQSQAQAQAPPKPKPEPEPEPKPEEPKASTSLTSPPPPIKSVWGRPLPPALTAASSAPATAVQAKLEAPPPSEPGPSKAALQSIISSLSRTSVRSQNPSSSGGGKRDYKRGSGSPGNKDRPQRPDMNLVENQKEIKDYVKSRQSVEGVLQSKKGTQGRQVTLYTNYYPLEKMTNFNLYHYHLEFKPGEERTDVRKKMVKIHEKILGAFIFDGQALYTPHRIELKSLCSMNHITQTKTVIDLKLVSEISPVDPIFLQVYNIIFRNIMVSMDLEIMGRFYYDPAAKVEIKSRKLELWPGYITSVRNHEHQVMLNLELTHKVVRADSVLDFINNVKRTVPPHMDYRKAVAKVLLGSVVVTTYVKKNYKVDDIKWEITPKDEFRLKNGSSKSYMDYYKEVYGMIIKDLTQPMLVSLPKKKDYHRGSNQPIYLVPEICQMTGLTEQMRADQALMKDISSSLIINPNSRLMKANEFIERWYNTSSIVRELQMWNIQVAKKPITCLGRVVDMDDLVVGASGKSGAVTQRVKQDRPGEWGNLFKQRSMLSTVRLHKWVVLIPPGLDQLAAQMIEAVKNQGKGMGFVIDEPVKFKLKDNKPPTYSTAIQSIFMQLKGNSQMFVTLLPNNYQETYSAIKKKTLCELGVASQCVIAKTLQTKNIISVTNRMAIQMNTKLGGAPWTVDIPLRELMVVGYDVFHSPNKRNPSVGALVASTSHTQAKFFTSTYFHKNRNELSANLCSAMAGALEMYREKNSGRLPARIILYRDGVGDGQLTYIYDSELPQILEAIHMVYEKYRYPVTRFSFIVVTKRIHTRIFQPNPACPSQMQNPSPGTIVDDVITLPERYDFYIVSQSVNCQGTVSPTCYNVLWDEQGLDPDKLQRLTLKLCHLYFNYSGTIGVPAPCQFAHKLAYMTGMSLSNSTHENLQNSLFFL